MNEWKFIRAIIVSVLGCCTGHNITKMASLDYNVLVRNLYKTFLNFIYVELFIIVLNSLQNDAWISVT